MGYDERHQSSSSGVLVAVVVVVLIVALLGILAVLGAGYFFVRTSQVEDMVARERVVAELHRAGAEAQREVEEARVEATPDPRLKFVVKLDREGNASVDGENIELDELRAKLVKLKEETSNAFSVHINADSKSAVKHVVAVVAVCDDVGDIDYRIKSFEGPAVQVTATVASYEPAAEWDHFDDGTFAAYDRITLQVVSPERHAGTTLSITVPPTALPDDSAFRAAGTRFTFMVRESDIAATGLSWGAIDDPTIVQLPVIPP